MTLKQWSEKSEELLDLIFPIAFAALLGSFALLIVGFVIAGLLGMLLGIGPLAETCEVPQ